LSQIFQAVWQRIAPGVPAERYRDAVDAHQRTSMARVRLTSHGSKIIGPEEAARLPDNSADYEPVTFAFDGLDEVKAMIADGKPVAFVTWHNGARHHADFGIARALPQTAIFTRTTYQYGKVFSIPMIEAQAFSLVQMDHFLREGRPIYYYLDGPPLGANVRLPILGVPSRVSTAPIRIIRSVAGVRIVPITNYYRDGNVVEYKFHPPLPAPDRLPNMSEQEILALLLDYLEQDLRQQAPEQVMLYLLLHRELRARQDKQDRALSRRGTP
jgi:lauroyl/myristoyl acyltransferase